jgi:alpha-tubulin suppressor-like RCC1 family protein
VCCGGNSSFIIDSDRNAWGFGFNTHGKLGLGHYWNKFFPTQIAQLKSVELILSGEYHTICVDLDGNLYSFGSNRSGQAAQEELNCLMPQLIANFNVGPSRFIHVKSARNGTR